SGYGLPLRQAGDCTETELALLSLVRPDDRGRSQGVAGFSRVVRAFRDAPLPVVFLPGVIHLPTVPSHRKINRIDLGTPDKLCVAVLALQRWVERTHAALAGCSACVVELGTAFSACVVLSGGQVVHGLGGSSGPVGWGSSGCWDGETAYLLSPLGKRDLFSGGARFVPDRQEGVTLLRESLRQAVAGLQAVTPFTDVVLSGRLLE